MNIENTILLKCEFDDECDFCIEPKGGTYIRKSGADDDFYWIYNKCFYDFAKENPNADEIKLMHVIDKSQEKLDVKLPF